MSDLNNISIVPKKIIEFKFIYIFGIIVSAVLSLYHHHNFEKRYDMKIDYYQEIQSSFVENELKRHFRGKAMVETSKLEIVMKDISLDSADKFESEILELNDKIKPNIKKVAKRYLDAAISSLEYVQNLEYERIKTTIDILEEKSSDKELVFDEDLSSRALDVSIPIQLFENENLEQIFLIFDIIEKGNDFFTIGNIDKSIAQSSRGINIFLFYLIISLLISSLLILVIELRKRII